MKANYLLAIVFGMLNIAHGLTHPVEGENLFVMAGIAVISWCLVLMRVNRK